MEEFKKRPKRQIDFETISLYIFYCLAFLLPIFVLPLGINAVAISKPILLYLGILSALFFWLFSRLKKGDISVPKSGLLLSLLSIVLVFFVSSIFSLNFKISLIGSGYDLSSFSSILLLSIALFLISILFQSEKKVFNFYLIIFASSLVVFGIQAAKLLLGVSIFGTVFDNPTSNLIGGWNDFAVFFGFIGLSSLVLFETIEGFKVLEVLFSAILAVSLLAMLAVNFLVAWIIFAIFTALLIIYLIFRSSESKNSGRNFVRMSVFVLLLVIVLIFARGSFVGITSFLGTNMIEVRPSFVTTYSIITGTLSDNLILGSGPNTFLYDWFAFKPEAINTTIFWNTRFTSGVGNIPSMIAETGIVGGVSFIVFFAIFLYLGLRVISQSRNGLKKSLLATSFLGALYLWTFNIVYSPGFLIFALAFLMSGIFLALLIDTGMVKNIKFALPKNFKISFPFVLAVVFLMIGSIYGLYIYVQKGAGEYLYAQGIKTINTDGDIEKAEDLILMAINLNPQSIYFRTLAEIGIAKSSKVLTDQLVLPEKVGAGFWSVFSTAISNAQRAVSLNPLDPLNWVALGRVYEFAVPLKIENVSKFAIDSYKEVIKIAPTDPAPLLSIAQIEFLEGNFESSRNYLEQSLKLKSNYAPAIGFANQTKLLK